MPQGLSHLQRTQSTVLRRDLFFSPCTPRHFVTIIIFLLLFEGTYVAQFLSSPALFRSMKCSGWKINIEFCF